MNRILFLDIDGVLNRIHDKPAVYMHPANIAVLNDLVKSLGLTLVLSSSWREHFAIDKFNEMFIAFGSENKVIAYTPVLLGMIGSIYIVSGNNYRGDEIQAYLTANDLIPGENCSICIVDDMESFQFKHLNKYLCQTSIKHGLLPKHSAMIKTILERQENDKRAILRK